MEDLWSLGAAELTEVLRERFASVGGLALETERGLARELVRRARRAELLQKVLERLLNAGEALAGGKPQPWEVTAARAREVLQPGRAETGSG